MLIDHTEVETDVVVIGGGGAAARAAYEAAQLGAKVVLVTKGIFGQTGATSYKVSDLGGFNIADGYLAKGDNPENHYCDIINAALGMCDPKLAQVLVEEALKEKDFLESIGVQFHKEGGDYLVTKSCFSSAPRCYTILGHGHSIVAALKKQITANGNIIVLENCLVTNLITGNSECLGIVALNQTIEAALVVKSKAVILAAGGGGQLFKLSMNPKDVTGDGAALAFRAGAELTNLEFIQFGVGTVYPQLNSLGYWMFLLKPRFINGKNEAFLENYLPAGLTYDQVIKAKNHFPFSSRDSSKYIETSIHNEIVKGNGAGHNGILLDFSQVDPEVERELPLPLLKTWDVTKKWFASRGIEITKEAVEVADYAHAFNGGAIIDENGATNIKGLFAAGENAAGPHGADRLGGNMLLTCQVFGRIAGVNAALYAQNKKIVENKSFVQAELFRLNDYLTSAESEAEATIEEFIHKLQELNWNYLGVVRNEPGLGKALSGINAIEASLKAIKANRINSLTRLVELENMIIVSKMIIYAAKLRQESRGSHYRSDFPEMDHHWDSNIIIQNVSGVPQILKRKIGKK